MPQINPEILVWARQTAGLTLEEAAKKVGVGNLAALENGQRTPTRTMLAKMAQHYRRPLIAFYLSQPPPKGDRGADFRSLSTTHPIDDARLDAMLRSIRARQSTVRTVLADEDETEPLRFIGSHTIADGQPAVLASLQALLKTDVQEYRAQRHVRAAFEMLREQAEKAGIFVLLVGNLGSHHTNIDPETFRGFAIADDIAPFVVINRNDAHPAWSFTLLHELVHLLLGQTGISAAPGANHIELFCNDVAGEFLLPADEAQHLRLAGEFDRAVEQICIFADERKLSRAMVAYKAYRVGAIDQARLNRFIDAFRQQQPKKKQGGPNYYVLRRFEVGKPLIEIARQMLDSGALTTSKVANVLDVKAGQVKKLIDPGN